MDDDAGAAQRDFVAGIDAERIHFVGHSFGGVVLCRYFQKHPCERAGPRGDPGLAADRQPLGAHGREEIRSCVA